ncbi:hypothetical protein SERLA73DRAFT_182542 [Serpula lacrymans var. lacrymans S7.3]|uniref:protein-tyrosine-phosphatase n=2 Tax=Serpula lacrymans var. lacrymans TaxID=341189 RepID=F8Q0G5_SERL3|nr:uncharacterized protein SERLADRAFT_469250 [Serpula lacrymans var. lacrymans S7.9]EGN97794.1 hypothetical protein SERLA73DRAFT_182542 [Serpula lacrymans var. lacrymans S7.3]EGO23386.1 hypothetical protein SERLADRAFT_469250 [Serpula lacrymans var. lacrymans S7.9]
MIRFEGMSPDVVQAMCTPMHRILPTSTAQSQSQSRSQSTQLQQQSTPSSGSLYLGSISATMDRDLLRAHHITHLVQVLDVPWLPISEKDGFKCLRIDILDIPTVDLRPHLEGACGFIAKALQGGSNVLVHCQQGVSRSPAIVIAYLIHDLGMTFDQAHALVKRHRPCINPNPGFVNALRAWEGKWHAPPVVKRFASYTGSSGSPSGSASGQPAFTRGMSYAGGASGGTVDDNSHAR